MERTLVVDTPKRIGQIVRLAGWVHVRRDHGKIIFVDLRDRTGIVQTVIIPDDQALYALAETLGNEYVIDIEGLVKERPASAVKDENQIGSVEVEVRHIAVLGVTKGDLPLNIAGDDASLHLDTLLDHRVLALRNEKTKAIFRLYAEVIRAYSAILRHEGFTEIKSPKILSNATEGDANFFKIQYFEREAFLAQSPQFYKQAGVGVFERVFEVGSVFRAEPHVTTRHINEYIGMDAEFGFIQGLSDVMDQLEQTMAYVFTQVRKRCPHDLKLYKASAPHVKHIPRMKLAEARVILEREYGKKSESLDIDPEGERLLGEWVRKYHKSDLLFLTHYPTKARPFYAMPSPENPEETESFDLLFRGVEIATGGQHIHDYDQLVASMQRHGLDPDDFVHYLDIFKYGMPPHGGWGLGSERVVQQLLGLKSIQEAVLFPRDIKRLTP